jgi:hypothetical protein
MIRTAATAFAMGTALAGMGALVAPASAVTEHCPDHNSSDVTKQELNYESTTLSLSPGTVICVKAGTQVSGVVTVGSSGVYTQDFAFNKKGKPLGISYYVVYKKKDYCPPKK